MFLEMQGNSRDWSIFCRTTAMPLSSPNKAIEAHLLATYADALRLYRIEHGQNMDSEIGKAVDDFPEERQIVAMTPSDLELFSETVDFCWRRVTGKHIQREESRQTSDSMFLDGCYWLLPGGVMVSGVNHYSAAKENRGLFCSLLNINPLVFEKRASVEPNAIVGFLIRSGAVRMMVDREGSKVFCQVSEGSWPWALAKLTKMYHKTKIARVLDDKKEYTGWESGVPVGVK